MAGRAKRRRLTGEDRGTAVSGMGTGERGTETDQGTTRTNRTNQPTACFLLMGWWGIAKLIEYIYIYICFVATERSSTDDATVKFDNFDNVDDDVDDSGDGFCFYFCFSISTN